MLTGVIFCDSDNLVAKEIKDVTASEMSHVALLFDNSTVLHFRFLGFEVMYLDEFKEIYKIHSILRPEKAIAVSPQTVAKHYSGKAYDFKGVIYLWLFFFLQRVFGFDLPGSNKWQDRKQKFCVEFAAEVCLGETCSTYSPESFHKRCLNSGFVDVTASFV